MPAACRAAPNGRPLLAVVRFALPQSPEGPSERRVLAMDYNLFVRHSGGFERSDNDGVFEERAYRCLPQGGRQCEMAASARRFNSAFDFTMMNGGAYWRALERFASDVCGRADVACITYSDYLARTAPGPTTANGDLGRLKPPALRRRADPPAATPGLLALEIALVDLGQRLAVERRFEGPQTLVDRHQLHDRRPRVDQILERDW